MALAIATNNAALQAAASASSVNRDMETSMARLSTGKRINSASDDAAGVAIASRLTAEIRGTDQAIRNALDGQALIDEMDTREPGSPLFRISAATAWLMKKAVSRFAANSARQSSRVTRVDGIQVAGAAPPATLTRP